jgi:hypothetical protein
MNAKDINYYKPDIEHFNILDNVGLFCLRLHSSMLSITY